MSRHDWRGAGLILLPYVLGVLLIVALFVAAWAAVPAP